MNEEYFIYHRADNLFSRILNSLLGIRQSMMAENQKRAESKLARRNAKLMAMKENYVKDRDRADFLSSRLSSLRDRIADCKSRLDSGCGKEEAERLESEIRRLNGAIRRRSSEYERVSASISDIIEHSGCSRMSIAICL